MIKKSVFENELITGMHNQLLKQAKHQDDEHLEKAADYINSAIEIFEDMGMYKHADKLLYILTKIATHDTKVKKLPSEEALKEEGASYNDFGAMKYSTYAKAKVNNALRRLGYTDREIKELIGDHNFISFEEQEKLLDMPPSFKVRLQNIRENVRASHLSDRHTKGLTSEKMISNLKDHGTVFNLSDDGKIGDLDIGEDTLEVSDNTITEIQDFEDEID